LRAELRRLGAEVRRLEDDNQALQERVAFLARELEETRAKIPKTISTFIEPGAAGVAATS